jgi:hypothetical protein
MRCGVAGVERAGAYEQLTRCVGRGLGAMLVLVPAQQAQFARRQRLRRLRACPPQALAVDLQVDRHRQRHHGAAGRVAGVLQRLHQALRPEDRPASHILQLQQHAQLSGRGADLADQPVALGQRCLGARDDAQAIAAHQLHHQFEHQSLRELGGDSVTGRAAQGLHL